MADINPPPTYAEVVLVSPIDSKPYFNPIWLQWFLQVAQYINSNGGIAGTVAHNDTTGLQGGGSTERYHLTAAEHSDLVAGFTVGKNLKTNTATALVTTTVAMNNGAGAAAGTLANAPAAGNPTKWIPLNDNGTTRYIPAW